MTKTYKRKVPKGVPILRGIVTESRNSIFVWCPYCAKAHKHGWEPDSPRWAISHRWPHCGGWLEGASPFARTGYYIGELAMPL